MLIMPFQYNISTKDGKCIRHACILERTTWMHTGYMLICWTRRCRQETWGGPLLWRMTTGLKPSSYLNLRNGWQWSTREQIPWHVLSREVVNLLKTACIVLQIIWGHVDKNLGPIIGRVTMNSLWKTLGQGVRKVVSHSVNLTFNIYSHALQPFPLQPTTCNILSQN